MLDEIIKSNNVIQYYISPAIGPFSENFKKRYKLKPCQSNNSCTVFYGMHLKEDFVTLKRHQGEKIIIFEGHDVDLMKQGNLISYIKNMPGIKAVICQTQSTKQQLLDLGVESILVDLDLVVDTSSVNICEEKKKIFLFNGFSRNFDKIYKKQVYDEIIKKLSQDYEIVLSSSLTGVNYSEFLNECSECFVGISVVDDHNSIEVMRQIGIPVIHNTEDSCTRWNSIDEIVDIVDRYSGKKQIEVKAIEEHEKTIVTQEEIDEILADSDIEDAKKDATDKITQNVLRDITDTIIKNVIANISAEVNTKNYKEMVFKSIEEELQKLNLI
jgi:hypothetical protein